RVPPVRAELEAEAAEGGDSIPVPVGAAHLELRRRLGPAREILRDVERGAAIVFRHVAVDSRDRKLLAARELDPAHAVRLVPVLAPVRLVSLGLGIAAAPVDFQVPRAREVVLAA